jgi:hypothetical protein
VNKMIPSTTNTTTTVPMTAMFQPGIGDRRIRHVDDQPHASATTVVAPEKPPDAVYIAFFKRRGLLSRGWLTLPAACWAYMVNPRYEHCQLVFAWLRTGEKPVTMTFGTVKELPSAFVNTMYVNDNWDSLPVPSVNMPTNEARRKRIFEWCMNNRNVPFNDFGYYCNFMPCVVCLPCLAYDAEGGAYFCAEQVVTALLDSNVTEVENVNPLRSTPTSIYDTLIEYGAKPTVLRRPDMCYARGGDRSGDGFVIGRNSGCAYAERKRT